VSHEPRPDVLRSLLLPGEVFTMSQKQEGSPVKKTASAIYTELVNKYGDDAIADALGSEVEDSKQSEAEMINEDGAEAQVTFLIEEGGYDADRLDKILKKYTEEDEGDEDA
jgi:hypothetical protein